MRYNNGLQLGSILTFLILSAGGAVAAPGHKTPKECNSELYARLGAIRAAGETPSQFVHDCWWHAQPGQPTEIVQPETATPREPLREAEVAPQDSRPVQARPQRRTAPPMRVAARRLVRAHPLAEARHAEATRRLAARMARAERVRVARLERRLRIAAARSGEEARLVRRHVAVAQRRTRLAAAGPKPQVDRLARVARLERAAKLVRVARAKRPAKPEWQTAATASAADRDLTATVASLGPSARAGQRMWVRVVAAGEVHIKPAVAVGSLSDRADSAALNCWGQQVMMVGRDGDRWSRKMVCDGKPAGANEWSAQIYYGGAAKR